MRTDSNGLWLAAGLGALVAAAGLAGLDSAIAARTAGEAGDFWFGAGTAWLDLVALKGISNFLLGAILIVAALLLLAFRRTRRPGWAVLYLALVQFVATTAADLAKPQFGRLRPFEATAADTWFVGANSFPSGHVAFYAGLFLPLILLFPRFTLLWLTVPLFVAAARVVEHDHYLSDVGASFALAAALAAALSPVAARARRGLSPA